MAPANARFRLRYSAVGRKTGMYGDLAGESVGPLLAASAAKANYRGLGLAMEVSERRC